MPVQANADNNVPWLGPRSRYTVIGTSPVWNYHRMGGAFALTGEPPEAVGLTANTTDPTSGGGLVQWSNLVKGGLFTALYKTKKSFVIEAVDLSAGVVLTIVRAGALATPTRTFPVTFPAKIAAGEIIRATAGANGGYAGILVRLPEEKIL